MCDGIGGRLRLMVCYGVQGVVSVSYSEMVGGAGCPII
jgi:hypothetical protein